MRRLGMAGLMAVIASACSSDSARTPVQPEEIAVPLRVESAQHAGTAHNHSVHLSGDQEVFTGTPHPADSNAQGQAIIQISEDGLSFDYKLIASNIENIMQAHIHCGPAGVNGPVVVWLYPSPTTNPSPENPLPINLGRHTGVLAEGTIISGAALHVRPTTNPACPGGVATFADVLARIREGNAYVNVHTNDGVAPGNTGPGDFPGGEIRGQM